MCSHEDSSEEDGGEEGDGESGEGEAVESEGDVIPSACDPQPLQDSYPETYQVVLPSSDGEEDPASGGLLRAIIQQESPTRLEDLAFAWLPSLQCVRHRSKAVTRHNRATHFERQKILALTEYIAPKPAVSESCVKPKVQKDDGVKDNLLEKFLCSQLENIIQENKMLAVFQRNAIGADDFLHLKHRLHKHEIYIKVFPLQVIRKVLDQSHLQELLPLFYGQTFLVVSPHTRVKEMLQAIRAAPQIQFLGACVENRLLSKQGLVNYSKLPSKELVQGQLAGTLTMLTAQTANLLTHHSAQLCAMLEQHGKEEGKEAKDN
ncbi:39S ribosomal protein L10, mitochondrial [Hyla sarda]|uniref:39S ribosomal protein L10, mitochondrial n=1 Tax=Hyla sarda TaxID=327740 RepID=UPI0024C270D8|nr:39S ribosomal protein L10, mitochondrial [Hyla sarda]